MPRGVYDRGESRVKRLTTENERLVRELHDTKHALEKAQLETKTRKEPTVSAQDPFLSSRFEILRSNLRDLAEARKTLVNSDQMGEPVLNALDLEIGFHIACMSDLRSMTFPLKTAPMPVATLSTAPGQVPFPAAAPSDFQSAVR